MDFYPNEQLQAVEATVDVAEFAYVPLKAERQEFRILTVHASSKCSTDTIHATLDIQSLLEKPQYETVSYCWGDASVRSTTVLNGHLFDVPASSEKTLRRLRHKDTDRVLWIDAICINQRNIDERSQQVAMMDLIYKSGIRNLIWLGETEPRHADDALEAFNVLWQGIISCTGDGNIMPFIWDAEERHGKSVRTLIVPAEFDFEPIRRVFRSQWFTRLWVIQEAALSATNICLFGHRELDLLQVLKTSKWLLASIPVLPFDLNPESGLMSAGEMWLFVDPFLRPPHRAYRGHLAKAMHSARGFKATEPKDYLYAVLGLVHVFMGHDLARDPLLLPDYRRALKDVYTDAAKYSIKESGEHEFFHGAFRRQVDREDPTWPSWLPRWDRAHNVAHDAYPLSRHHSAGISTQVAARLVSHETDAGLTMFPGFMLDTVKHANEPLPFPGGSLDEGIEYTYDNIVESYIDAKTTFMQHALSNSDRESQWPKVLGQTLTAGINHLNQTLTPDSAAEMLLLLDKYMQQATLPPEDDDDDDDVPFDEQADLASDMHFSMRMMWTHRRFFATNGGFFGLGPGFMAPGDRVAVLYGCRCPVVLRPLQHEDAYEFIGVAYVHGIMEGQAIDGDLKSRRGPDTDICMR